MRTNGIDSQHNTMRTAVLTAYPRIFTDIDRAADVFFAAARRAVSYGFTFEPSLFVPNMAIELEARHKSLSRRLAALVDASTLVVELGAGLSTRRMEFPAVAYRELDFPTMVRFKADIYTDIGCETAAQDLVGVDLSAPGALASAIADWDLSPYRRIVVLSEGLFWYLKRKDIADMIRCFENAFAGTEWMWLTADCPVEERVDTEYRSVIADSSGRSPVEPFADYTDFAAFLHEHGFTVQRSKMTETVSPRELYAATFFSVDEAETRERMESYTDIALLTRA